MVLEIESGLCFVVFLEVHCSLLLAALLASYFGRGQSTASSVVRGLALEGRTILLLLSFFFSGTRLTMSSRNSDSVRSSRPSSPATQLTSSQRQHISRAASPSVIPYTAPSAPRHLSSPEPSTPPVNHRLSYIIPAAPAYSEEGISLAALKDWAADVQRDPVSRLAQTVLSKVPMKGVLMKRQTMIEDQQGGPRISRSRPERELTDWAVFNSDYDGGITCGESAEQWKVR